MNQYLLNGDCLTSAFVYRVDVITNSNDKHKFYFSLADTVFKDG